MAERVIEKFPRRIKSLLSRCAIAVGDNEALQYLSCRVAEVMSGEHVFGSRRPYYVITGWRKSFFEEGRERRWRY